jgi:uncharacterized protein
LDTVEGQISALDSTYATDAALSSAVSAINTAVTAGFTNGATRMTAIEAVNTTQNGRLDAVEGDLAALDATYASDAALSGAVSALEAADAAIASDLADEVSAREAAVAAVASDLSDEVARATAAEGSLDSRLDTVEGQISALDSTYATDAALSSAVSSINTAVTAGFTNGANRMTAIEAVNTTQNGRLDAVEGDIADEVSARESADSALDSRLDSVEGTLAALDATYATEVEVDAAVAVETAARESADSALDARLDTIESNFTRKYAVAVGNGSATSFTVTHNLGTSDVVVSVREASTGAVVVAAVTHSTDNTVTVAVNGTAPANNALKVVVIG